MLKLILADDERAIRETISKMIDWKSLGVELVGLCKDGIEAYNMILDESPDLVMTDIRMPGLSGLELVKEVREAELPVHFIILSGYEEFEYAREAMGYGIKHYLIKPCREEQIRESILEAVKEVTLSKSIAEEKAKKLIMQQMQNIYEKLEDSDQDSTGALCEELKSLADQIMDIESLRLLAASAGIRLSVMDSGSAAETAEFLHRVRAEKSLDALKRLFRKYISESTDNLLRCRKRTGGLAEAVMDYVEKHISDPSLTLKKIAEQYLFMNVDYVSRQFQKTTGIKFSQHLTEQRVRKAKELLLREDGKIQYVARQVGCGDNSQYFSQIFKKVVGITPSRWVKQMKDRLEEGLDS